MITQNKVLGRKANPLAIIIRVKIVPGLFTVRISRKQIAVKKNEPIPMLVRAIRRLFVLRRNISDNLAPKRMVIQAPTQGIIPIYQREDNSKLNSSCRYFGVQVKLMKDIN